MPTRVRATLKPVVTLALFAGALWAVDQVLREYRYTEILRALGEVPSGAVGLALAFTALAYMSLVGYDRLAFRLAGRPLPWRAMLVPSFVSFAVANSAPAAVVTGGGVRYRMYGALGFTMAEAAVVAGFNVITYALGLAAVAGAVMLLHPVGLGPAVDWSLPPGRTLGFLLVAGVVAYLVASALHPGAVELLGRRLRLPTLRVATEQLAVSVLEWLLSSTALFVLLGSVATVSYLDFLGVYFAAAAAALVFPVPGGLGVFEAVVLLLRPAGAPAPEFLAALLLYRVIYYLLPLLAAALLLGIRALRQAGRGPRPLAAVLHQATAAAPLVLSFTTFLSGALLVLTGAIPQDQRQVAWLADLLPVAAIEASHLFASLVGSALVILAWGLERRVRLAYQLARVLFLLGVLLSLGRSFDLRLAALMVVALVVLLAAGRHFPRHASLIREPLSLGWIFAIGAVAMINVWLGVVIYRSVELSDALWWRFALDEDAPRILRAAVGASAVAMLFGIARLLAHHAPPHARPGGHEGDFPNPPPS